MTEEESRIVDQMIDDMFGEKPKPETPKVRRAVCARCGAEFETTRPSAKLCQACRSAAKKANAMGARGRAEKQAAPPPDPKPEQVPDPKPEQVPEIKTPVTLTLGAFRRLLDGVPEDAALRIDGNPVRTVFVERFYDLEHGTERYSVELDL